jgi:hypothetical protein
LAEGEDFAGEKIRSGYFKGWMGDTSCPAMGTTAGTGKTLAVFKNKSALEAFARSDTYFSPPGLQRPRNMAQVVKYFFFPDSHLPG